MFTPIHLLPQFNTKELNIYRDRWNDTDGQRLRDKVLEMIRNGAGEDFLQRDFEQGKLGFLENMCDLKGIDIFKEDINFPASDNFEGINFSYAKFYHSKLKNAVFLNTTFNFIKMYNCEFINCIFLCTSFYGASLEKIKFINCDFIEGDKMTNCDFRDSKFKKCFYIERLFFDCRFDETTSIENPINEPLTSSTIVLNKSELAEIYKGIKENYVAGNVFKQSRQYFFKQKQCITRHNAKNLREKILGYFLELIAGYGIKPIRTLLSMLVMFLFYSSIFVVKIGTAEGLILSAGAFFTFGASTNYLQTLGVFFKIIYIAEAFTGISLITLFITVIAKLWFGEK